MDKRQRCKITNLKTTMKKLVFLSLLLLTVNSFAAAPYDGGPGDGWDVCAFTAKNPYLAFINVPDTLTAGVSSGNMVVQLFDGDGNPLLAPATLTINLGSTSSNYLFQPTDIYISQGQSQSNNIHYTDYVAGNSIIAVNTPISGYSWVSFPSAITISPNATHHFTVNPDGAAAVLFAEGINVTACDQYNNIATNYTGTAVFTSTGSMTMPSSSHTFVSGDNGVYSFTVNDSVVEKVNLTATDSVSPSITGVSPSIHFNGTYISGVTDLGWSANLMQGQNDVAMLRFDMKASSATSTWNKVRVDRLGTSTNDDINYAKIYLDNGNGVFNGSPQDVMIGSAAFTGNNPCSKAMISVTPQTVSSSTTKMYYVTYDVPISAVEGNTAGAQIAGANYFTMASGLPMGTNNIPAVSSTSTIFAVPRTLTITPTDLTPSLPPVYQGQSGIAMEKLLIATDFGPVTLKSVKINKSAASTCFSGDIKSIAMWRDDGDNLCDANSDVLVASDAFASGSVLLNMNESETTTPQAYFLVADIAPASHTGVTFGMECTESNFFTVDGLNSVSSTHFPIHTSTITINPMINMLTVTPFSVAPAEVYQGSAAVTMLKFTLTANQNSIVWSRIKIDQLGTAIDSDISAIKVFTNDGILISGGSDVFSNGKATVLLSQPQTIIQGTPQTYYVTVDINPNAEVAGITLSVGTTSYFTVSSPNYISPVNFPIHGNTTIRAYPDTMMIQLTAVGPAAVNQGAQNISIVKMNIWSTMKTVLWSNVQISNAGTLSDSDITAVKIFRDANANGYYDGSDSLISSGVDIFSETSANITLNSPESITPSTRTYFAVVSVSSTATPTNSIKMQLQTNFFAVNLPNSVLGGLLFISSPTIVNPPSVVVSVSGTSLSTASVKQGATLVPVMKLVMNSNNYWAVWQSIRLNLSGTAQNSDISRILIYKDSISSGVFNAAQDELLNTTDDKFALKTANITLTSPQTLTTTPQTYFVVVNIDDNATQNATFGCNLASEGCIIVDFPNTVSSSGFPINSGLTAIDAEVNTVTVVPTNSGLESVMQTDTNKVLEVLTLNSDKLDVLWSALTLSLTTAMGGSDTDISAIKIYRVVNPDGSFNGPGVDTTTVLISAQRTFSNGQVTIPMITPEHITNTPKKYLIAVDISQTATVGAMIGIRAADQTSVIVGSPNIIDPANFPWSCTQPVISDQPDTLLVSGATNLAGDTVDQGGVNAPMLKVGLCVDHDSAVLNTIKVTKLGTLNELNVKAVNIYCDTNNNSIIDVQSDPLLGSAAFLGGDAIINIVPQLLIPTTQYYIISCDIDTGAVVGASLGVQLKDANSFSVVAPDLKSSQNLPLSSSLPIVRDIRTPTKPIVTADSAFTSHFQEINAAWQSQVIGGTIIDSQYAIGSTPGGVDVKNWTSNGTNQTILAQGLSLENGATYYISVKTESNFDLWSDIGINTGITVDLSSPTLNGTPSISKDGTTYMVQWPAAQAGVSGVIGYELQQRVGTSPVWTTVSTLMVAAPSQSGAKKTAGVNQQTSYVLTGLSDGTYFYRVRALNGANIWSEFTAPVRLVVGMVSSDVFSAVSAYPNPFNSKNAKVTINYTLNSDSNVKIKIYDLYGHFVNELDYSSGANGGMMGSNDAVWDGTDKNGDKVSMGGYIAILTSDLNGAGNKVVVKIGVVH